MELSCSAARGLAPALPGVKAPETGTQPAPPYWNCPASGAPALSSLRRYHVAVVGSNTPMPLCPLPPVRA